MSDLNHAICNRCWDARHPEKPSTPHGGGELERCCYCLGPNQRSGIYVRALLEDTLCGGEHPSPEAYLETRLRQALIPDVQSNIDSFGWHAQGVFGDDGTPNFLHTVGLTAHGRPELMIAGLPFDTMHAIVNDLVERILADDWVPPIDERVPGVLVDFDVRFVEADDAPVNVARAFYPGVMVRTLQVQWPDGDNRLPGDEGFSLPREMQEVGP